MQACAGLTGLRLGELRGLTLESYEIARDQESLGWLNVTRSVWRNIVGDPKTDTTALQSTANTAAGLAGYGLAPGDGMDSFTGPWLTEIDVGLQRRFRITELQSISLQAQVFNLFNSANYYVEAGGGINQIQHTATGTTCGDGKTLHQICILSANNGVGGFQTRSSISQPNGPRIMQFSFHYNF
ncbi:MAG TPA: hypothetical protein VEI52_05720 [Terriglobales bacterium]|nr:hypothetical protein [Terriglobales bacterium]